MKRRHLFKIYLLLAAFAGSSFGMDAPADFNGDGRTDFSVVRNAGGPSGQLTWYTLLNGPGTFTQGAWGIATDFITPGDYDGDGKDDIVIWRAGVGGVAGFYILQSGNGAFRFAPFGQTGDDPFVVADYTGDGKDDPAIYREGKGSGQQSVWWYLASSGPLAGQPVATAWGSSGDIAVPGDFTGDGTADLCVQRSISGQGVFFIHPGTGGVGTPGPDIITYFGLGGDTVVPGDYDGDAKTDLAVTRIQGNSIFWYYLRSSDGGFVAQPWGLAANDFEVQGDYDGDGKTDIAVWRAAPGSSTFYVNGSLGGIMIQPWGLVSDVPTAYDIH